MSSISAAVQRSGLASGSPWLVRHGQGGRGAIALEADGALIELSLD